MRCSLCLAGNIDTRENKQHAYDMHLLEFLIEIDPEGHRREKGCEGIQVDDQ